MMPAYKSLINRGVDPNSMALNFCESASGKHSMAQKYSYAHPFTTVVGFDGYAMYGTVEGVPMIYQVSTSWPNSINNLGYRIVFFGGIVVDRTLYSEYLKTINK